MPNDPFFDMLPFLFWGMVAVQPPGGYVQYSGLRVWLAGHEITSHLSSLETGLWWASLPYQIGLVCGVLRLLWYLGCQIPLPDLTDLSPWFPELGSLLYQAGLTHGPWWLMLVGKILMELGSGDGPSKKGMPWYILLCARELAKKQREALLAQQEYWRNFWLNITDDPSADLEARTACAYELIGNWVTAGGGVWACAGLGVAAVAAVWGDSLYPTLEEIFYPLWVFGSTLVVSFVGWVWSLAAACAGWVWGLAAACAGWVWGLAAAFAGWVWMVLKGWVDRYNEFDQRMIRRMMVWWDRFWQWIDELPWERWLDALDAADAKLRQRLQLLWDFLWKLFGGGGDGDDED